MKDGEPEYAILPYAEYQALLKAARQQNTQPDTPAAPAVPTPEPAPATASPMAQMVQQLQMVAGEENDAADGSFSGSRVAELRQQKGMDSKTLARGIGISPLYLAQIESGERMPGDAIWHNIARELQVSQGALKTGE